MLKERDARGDDTLELVSLSLSLSRARNGEVIYGLYSVDVNITTNLMGLFHIDEYGFDPE